MLDQLPDLTTKPELPFMIMASANMATHVNKQRTAEAVIIAVVTAGITGLGGYFLALPVLQERLDQVRIELRGIRQDMREDRDHTEVVVNRLDDRLRLLEIRQGMAGK